MPRTSEQNEAIKNRRKKKIMGTALKLFALNGYNNVTIDDIAKATNCSHGLFYHYFKDKGQIMTAIKEDMDNGEWKPFIYDRNTVMNKSGIDGLNYFCSQTSKLINQSDNLIYYVIIVAEQESGNQLFAPDSIKNTMTDLILKGQEEGSVREGDPNAMVDMFFDFVAGAFVKRIKDPTSKPSGISVNQIMHIFAN